MAITNFLNGFGRPQTQGPGGILQAAGAQNALQMQMLHQQHLLTQQPAPGSLIIQDDFQPSPKLQAEGGIPPNGQVSAQSSHGEIVAHSAVSDGFKGPVIERQLVGADGYGLMKHGLDSLQGGELNQQQALGSIRAVVDGNVSGILNQQSKMLDVSTSQGARNTVTNISQGTGKARITQNLYFDPLKLLNSEKPGDREKGVNTINNYATAFGLDKDKLFSKDPAVNGPERQKLQQNLANVTGDVIDNSPWIAQASHRFGDAVQRYEAGNNSVVVSAGNDGLVENRLEKSNYGLNIDVPADFDRNVLQNDQVTSVGATRWFNNNGQLTEKRAGYTNEGGGADIYASGSVDFNADQRADSQGTSFAGPRVAATMAQLHRDNPDLSSSQIEGLMKQSLTHSLDTPSGSVAVLDYNKSFEFLSNGTY